ncbi:hypothetical protein I5I84_00535 [Pseudomonas aeruginosa]|nr:hypothetical protein [Pseudomonas aeruginosa]
MKYLSPIPLFGAAVALLLAALALANGNWLSAFLFIVAGVLLAIRSVTRVPLLHETPLLELGAGLFTVVSIIAVFAGNRAFHSENAAAHAELLERLSEAAAQQNFCPSHHHEISAILQAGIKNCGLQDTRDMMSMVSELKKAESFRPALSVIDGLTSSPSSGHTDACYESYIKASELCPSVLGSVSKEAVETIHNYREARL